MSNLTKQQQRTLIDLARQAQKNAYAPYSQFKVGCAILAEDGNLYSGCNVENTAFPLGQCAEATALGQMVVNGCQSVEAVVILSPNESTCSPCGGCRQKLAEFSNADTPVYLVTQDEKVSEVRLGDLLPMAFAQ